jgi:GNAT superfamily N-acetyltransferase
VAPPSDQRRFEKRIVNMIENTGLQIVPIDLQNRKKIKQFINFHYAIYKDDPNWVAPLIVDYLERLNPKKNPYFLHSEVQPFIAVRDGRIVGRITAHENTRHVEYHKEKVGFFGFFECEDDQEVANGLFFAAANWLREKGLDTMRGPASFSVNGDPVALLVDGFDSPPVIGMSYNPSYYEGLIAGSGFEKAQDLYAYHFAISKEVPERFRHIAERAMRDPKLNLRRTKLKNLKIEIENLKFIYNEAWSENWGAVPMTDEEFDHFAGELKLAVDQDVTIIAEYDGKPVGLSMVFKDFNQALKPVNGRLLPFGIIKLLRARKKINICRVPILGVLEPYRNRGIDVALYVKSMDYGYQKGYRESEMSWILESNSMMISILEHMGMKLYKTYRIYDRDIR